MAMHCMMCGGRGKVTASLDGKKRKKCLACGGTGFHKNHGEMSAEARNRIYGNRGRSE